MDLALKKKQLASQFGVDETTIHNWEDKGVAPALRFMPRIIKFLGYDPTADDARESLAERLKGHRTRLGLSRQRLAALLEIDQSNLAGWETGKHRPTKRSLTQIERFLASRSLEKL